MGKEHKTPPRRMPSKIFLALPPATAYWRGHTAIVVGQFGVRDRYYVCLKNANGTHSWYELGTSSMPGQISTFLDDFQGSVLGPDWTVTVNGAGNVAMLVGAGAVDGGAVNLQDTGAAGANDAQISLGTNRFVRNLLYPSFEARVAVSNVLAGNGTRVRCILHNIGAYGAAGDWAGFEFDAATHANWRAKGTAGGGPVQDMNSLVPVVAGQYYILRFDFLVAGTILMSVDYTIVATIAAAAVSAARLEPVLYIDDGGVGAGNALNLIADYVWINQNRT